jgi:hypothetical protein
MGSATAGSMLSGSLHGASPGAMAAGGAMLAPHQMPLGVPSSAHAGACWVPPADYGPPRSMALSAGSHLEVPSLGGSAHGGSIHGGGSAHGAVLAGLAAAAAAAAAASHAAAMRPAFAGAAYGAAGELPGIQEAPRAGLATTSVEELLR